MNPLSSTYQQTLERARGERMRHIAAWRENAPTQAAYCAQHGLSATTFSGWLHARGAPRRVLANAGEAAIASNAVATAAAVAASKASEQRPLEGSIRSSARTASAPALTLIALRAPSTPLASSPAVPSSPSPWCQPNTLIGPGGWRIELGSLANVATLLTMLAHESAASATPARNR